MARTHPLASDADATQPVVGAVASVDVETGLLTLHQASGEDIVEEGQYDDPVDLRADYGDRVPVVEVDGLEVGVWEVDDEDVLAALDRGGR